MNLSLHYLGHSGVVPASGGLSLLFAPNLARPRTFLDAELREPVRFREAVSALHEVVVGDLRFRKKDRTAYLEWQKDQAAGEEELRRSVSSEAKKAELARLAEEPPPEDLEAAFRKMHGIYWKARRTWANELARIDPELFRHLVPCDPVVTVAPDVVLFEAFAKDESSYGCLSLDRGALSGHQEAGLGTTNVDYSLALYEHFQTLRSYRPTRLLVDPTGFEVNVAGRADYREERIDLPPSWLRGFGQLQAAMALPSRRIDVPVEAVYSILAFLKRHRERTGPRSLRFLLEPGKPASIVLEPWGVVVPGRGRAVDGDRPEEIKVWGRRRLLVLSRLLPLVERFEVTLLGSGLPSIWTAFMGEMRFTLALSGWTTNDWTAGANLDLLAGTLASDPNAVEIVSGHLEDEPKATFRELESSTGLATGRLLGALHDLARRGQVLYDFASGAYRQRPALPFELSAELVGPEPPELAAARQLFHARKVAIRRTEELSGGRTLYVAKVEGTSCETILDGDGRFTKARCTCKVFFKGGLRAGPCGHLLALRFEAHGAPAAPVNFTAAAGRWIN